MAGALITPLLSVDPLMGVPWLLNAFMLVMVSGTSLASLALACIVLGGAQVVVSTYGSPVLGALTIVVLAAVLLRIRPSGFRPCLSALAAGAPARAAVRRLAGLAAVVAWRVALVLPDPTSSTTTRSTF